MRSRPKLMDSTDFNMSLQNLLLYAAFVGFIYFIFAQHLPSLGLAYMDTLLLVAVLAPSVNFNDWYYYDDAEGVSKFITSKSFLIITFVLAISGMTFAYLIRDLVVPAVFIGLFLFLLYMLSTYHTKLYKLNWYRNNAYTDEQMLEIEGNERLRSNKVFHFSISVIVAVVLALLIRLLAAVLDLENIFHLLAFNTISSLLFSLYVALRELVFKHGAAFVNLMRDQREATMSR